ncbi:tyrosyl-trna synthetase [Leptolyngbya sp. Heron Island J]|uniref:tyrosine--tRNA ligase n=1 Tax=Leptolyngbya sp. Heron Island J TaxID=1385935 RepID=UPI0003B9BCF9|nr:tyrosine--tRNA ligase [Leptolyngbya sp. Heron Island J]ESA34153.1 tyrosyl-trna synthetase [Leptolyngbya sp. Heron Island J]
MTEATNFVMPAVPDEFQSIYRGVSEVFPHQPESNDPDESLLARLQQTDRPLRVKLGIDPTGAEIHVGHSIPVRKLRAFQDSGHTAILLIGDFTARIGDPTGKSEVRKQLTEAEVKANAETYIEQVRPILDFDTPGRLEIRYNSEWLSELDLSKIINLLGTMTVGQMLAKEGFAKRYEQGNPVYLHEFLYPLLQGYDSVALQADVELGGTDQKFNIAVGRDMLRHFGHRPQFGLLMPLLLGTDGSQKMSKSLGNYVGLQEDPLSMYSKLEKVPDALIAEYFELLTKRPLDHLPDNPREAQKQLALDITAQFHGEAAAQQAQKDAINLVQGGAGKAEAVPEFSLTAVNFPAKVFYLLGATPLCSSSSDARRQIKGGAVKLDGEKVSDPNLEFGGPDELAGKVLQVGKKKFVRLVP